MSLEIAPLTPDRAGDLAKLFQADSIARSCWCMFWRHPRGLDGVPKAERRAAFEARIAGGPRPPGLIARDAAGPAGWVQITPRDELPRFQRVPTARAAADTAPDTWALSCFFLRKDLRGQGMTERLARAACAFAAREGAAAVEASARKPGGTMAWGEGFTGLVPALSRAGFVPVETRSKWRVLMRWRA